MKNVSKIGRRTMSTMAFLTIIISVAVCTMAGYQYYTNRMESYRSEAYGYAGTLANMISGDRVEKYAETHIKDTYYDAVQRYMDSALKECGMLYYYVFIPHENDLMYIWDADNELDRAYLGEYEKYVEGDKEAAFEAMSPNPPKELRITKDDKYGTVVSAFSPVFNKRGEAVAIAACDFELSDMLTDMLKYILTLIGGIVLISFGAGVMLTKLLSSELVQPILDLNTAASNMINNLDSDSDFELNIHTGDELDDLAQSFRKMHTDLKTYIGQLADVTAEKERIGTELVLARRIQADLLPSVFPPFPERSDFDIFASMKPAKEVGGDFYDFYLIDDYHLGFCIADVSGKGIPAALFMMMSRIMLRNYTMSGKNPAEVLEIVNRQLCSNNREEMFVTVWLGIMDMKTGKVIASNAGHEYPVIKAPDGDFKVLKDKHGFVLGGIDGMQYTNYELQMEPGSKIFLYTDGVTETTNVNNELFGMDRMINALNSVNKAAPLDIINKVNWSITNYAGAAPQFDDITMLCIEYNGYDPDHGKIDELTLEATIENINRVTGFINKRLEEINCPPKAIMQIDVAIDELFGNIAHYAYDPQIGPATVRIGVDEDPMAAVITFIDHGKPYDPLAKEDPDTSLSAEERKIGGLGIFLVKQTMDQVEYEYKDGQNILKIKKNM